MKRLDLLDYGRFAAAVSVCIFHYLFNGIANGKISSVPHIDGVIDIAKYGYLGVEFFFMISGYVIFFSANNRSASSFAVSRVVRLYPAFWAAVIFTSMFAAFWGGKYMSVTLPQVIVNLTMLPRPFGFAAVDGVYWTLAYELSFYALVFLLLLFGQGMRLRMYFLFWPFAISVCGMLGLDTYFPIFGGYYSYFAAGALLAMLKEKNTNWTVLALLVSLANCLAFSAYRGIKIVPGYEFSPAVVIAFITAFFMFFLAANTSRGLSIPLPHAKLLGALTYPIYLIHAHFGYMLISRFATPENNILVVAAVMIAVGAIAYAIHLGVEVRYANAWRLHAEATVGRISAWATFKLNSGKKKLG